MILHLFSIVVHFDGASGFDDYIESVEMYKVYFVWSHCCTSDIYIALLQEY